MNFKRLKKRLKEIERRLWLIENPRKFSDGQTVTYWPVLTVTTEGDNTEHYSAVVRYESEIKHGKIYGEHYWCRQYVITVLPSATNIIVNESNLTDHES